MRSGLQDVVQRTVAKCEQYIDLHATDDIYLLLNAAQRENFSPSGVGQKSQSLGDKFSSLGDIYVTML